MRAAYPPAADEVLATPYQEPEWRSVWRCRVQDMSHLLLIAVGGGIYLYLQLTLPIFLATPEYRAHLADLFAQGRFFARHGQILAGYILLVVGMMAGSGVLNLVLPRYTERSLATSFLLGSIAVFTGAALMFFYLVKPYFWFFLTEDSQWHEYGPGPYISCFLGAVTYVCFLTQQNLSQIRKEEDRIALENRTLSASLERAELSLLEAQVEPHFLFNALANIKRQYRSNSVRADAMLCSLITYLNTAMPAIRSQSWTLGQEIELVKSYLEVSGQRFGSRLRYELSISEECARIRFPALVIATLVENAIRHGLSPKPEGGLVTVTGEIEGQILRIRVQDDGIGFIKSSGHGLGLSTANARLRNAFGTNVRFDIGPAAGSGVCALVEVELPYGYS